MTRKHSQFIFALLAIIGVGVLILLAGALSWHKQTTVVMKLEDEIDQKRAEKEAIEEELKKQPAMELRLEEIEKQLATLDKDMVDYKFIPTYLKQIQRATKRTGNTLRAIQPEVPEPLDLSKSQAFTGINGPASEDAAGPQYQVQRINLDMTGNYASVLRLLDALRRFPKMIYVRSVNVTPNGNDVSGVNARMETYVIITPDQYQTPADEKAAPTEAKP